MSFVSFISRKKYLFSVSCSFFAFSCDPNSTYDQKDSFSSSDITFTKILLDKRSSNQEKQRYIDLSVHRGAVLQASKDGTKYACALLSLLTAYNACHNYEAIQIADERFYKNTELGGRPKFKKLVEFYDSLPYKGRIPQSGWLYRYTPETYLRRHGYNGSELERKLEKYKGPQTHYSSKKIGNIAWLMGMTYVGLSHKNLDPGEMNKDKFKEEVIKAIEEPGTVLMFHGFNHYTCIGGYEVLEDGSLALQISLANQKPCEWYPLSKIVAYLKRVKNSRLFAATKN